MLPLFIVFAARANRGICQIDYSIFRPPASRTTGLRWSQIIMLLIRKEFITEAKKKTWSAASADTIANTVFFFVIIQPQLIMFALNLMPRVRFVKQRFKKNAIFFRRAAGRSCRSDAPALRFLRTSLCVKNAEGSGRAFARRCRGPPCPRSCAGMQWSQISQS